MVVFFCSSFAHLLLVFCVSAELFDVLCVYLSAFAAIAIGSPFQDYGCYLDADAVAGAVSCREMGWALREALTLAAHCQSYRDKER